LARARKPVTLKSRRIRIDTIELVDVPDVDHAEFRVIAGKGAYMRSLARDIAIKLGTVGHVSALRRLSVGPFDESGAIPLDNLIALGHSAPLLKLLLPIETALDDIPALALTEAEVRSLRHGQAVPVLPVANRMPHPRFDHGVIVCVMAAGKAAALARIVGAEIRPVRILNV
jgi:tRNA pseudouridine55 synthase